MRIYIEQGECEYRNDSSLIYNLFITFFVSASLNLKTESPKNDLSILS